MPEPQVCGFAAPTGGPSRKCEHSKVEASGGVCRMPQTVTHQHTVEDEMAANDAWRAEQRASE
jgi:hypothetical protein